jgi:4-amino-4-deoxy-L-arabinose transferase-like glycosyltransferase
LGLGGIVLLAAALRFDRLGHQSFWYDEAWTAYLVRLHPGEMLRAVPQSESTPPLYYALAWVWARIFGFHEAGLRSLSALAGTVTVVLAYVAGATLATRRIGLVAAALAATSPILVWYGQEARSYALLVALAALSLLCFARARARPSGRRLAAWALASIAALATHYFAAFAVAPEAALLLWQARRGAPWRATLAAAGAVAACGAALLVLALHQLHRHNAAWNDRLTLGHRLGELPRELLAGFPPGPSRWLPWASGAVVLAALALLATRSDARERRAATLAAALGLAAVLLPLAFAALGADYLLTRNLLVAWLPLALVLAAGLGARRAGRAGSMLVVVLCVLSLTEVAAVARQGALERPSWGALTAALGPSEPGRAIVLRRTVHGLPLAVQRAGAWVMTRPARVREIDVVTLNTRGAPGCWWGATCEIAGARPVTRAPVAGFALAGDVHAGDFTIARFLAHHPLRLTRAQLALRPGNAVMLDGIRSLVPAR